LISHRLASLATADKILVLDGGRICEQGTHEQLIALGGCYAKLYKYQNSTDASWFLE
jgi:ABC-type multidrug transport system fused ATPase/permease subunit